jgi:hypothetical protein
MEFISNLIKENAWLTAIIVGVVTVSFLVIRKTRTKGAKMNSARKSRFENEITSAKLIIDGGTTEVTFTELTGVDVALDHIDVTLTREKLDTNLFIGHHDLLVCTGTPEACKMVDTRHVRIWSRGKLIYDQRLGGVEIEDGCILAYTENGADVILVHGKALTMIIDEI